MTEAACEVWFYHLERSGADEVLPTLLEKTLAAGWRALVVAGDAARLPALDARLWTYSLESFLPHGLEDEPHASRQPILLSTRAENVNGAKALFLVDGAEAPSLDGYTRCLDLFDGRDPEAVAAARGRWKAVKAMGAVASYWRQGEAGGWRKQA